MAIIKTRRTTNFTVLPNELLNDTRLKWNDLGLLAHLLSKPESWSVRIEVIRNQRGTSKDAIYASLKRIRELGYASVRKNIDGTTEWIIYDNPNPEIQELVDSKPHPENPDPENPDPEIQDVYKRKISSKERVLEKKDSNRKILTDFPDNFEVTLDMCHWAVEEGVPESRIMFETQQFKDYCLSKGLKYKDWLATWRNWMRRAVIYNYKKIA